MSDSSSHVSVSPIDSPTSTASGFRFFDEDGLARVKRLFREVLNGEPSVEAGFITNTFYHSLFAGFFAGATIGMIPSYQEFKRRFNEYQFQSKTSYARKLLDCTVIACGRNGIRIAWRATALVCLFTGTAAILSVYHNDIRFSNFILAASLSGGLYTFHRGPKAMLAGFILGGLGGLPVAGLAKGFFWASGTTYGEVTEKCRGYYDAPSIRKAKKYQLNEIVLRDTSVPFKDTYKSYIYHQRRVNRLEEQGIVDDSFVSLKPGKAYHPKEFERMQSGEK